MTNSDGMTDNLEEALESIENDNLKQAARLVDAIKDKLSQLGVYSAFVLWAEAEDGSAERLIGNNGCILCAADLIDDYIEENDLVHESESH